MSNNKTTTINDLFAELDAKLVGSNLHDHEIYGFNHVVFNGDKDPVTLISDEIRNALGTHASSMVKRILNKSEPEKNPEWDLPVPDEKVAEIRARIASLDVTKLDQLDIEEIRAELNRKTEEPL